MEASRYRVVLTGEVVEGHQIDAVVASLATLFRQPPEKLRRFFGNKPIPLNQELELEQATRVRDRILAAGARCDLEPVGATEEIALTLEAQAEPDTAPASKAAMGTPESAPVADMTCPKCGHAQPRSDTCARCGVVIAKVLAKAAEQAKAAAQEDEPLPEREELEALFIGPNADVYLDRFARFRDKNGYAFTWHWPALFVPFYWALYRKLWGWAAVTGLLWPIINPVFAACANYLYYRHTQAKVDRFLRRSGQKNPESLMAAGGISKPALWISIALAAVGAAIFIWLMTLIAALAKNPEAMESLLGSEEKLTQAAQTPEDKATLAAINRVGMSVIILKMSGQDVAGLDMDGLQKKLQMQDELVADGWGTRLELQVEDAQFTIASAGPDTEFDTEDDLVTTRPIINK